MQLFDRARKPAALFLSLCLALFTLDAFVGLLDDALGSAGAGHPFSFLRGSLAVLSAGAGLAAYFLIGVSPMVPKRYFLPVVLFTPLANLAALPIAIYQFPLLDRMGWILSLSQLCLAGAVIVGLQGGWRWQGKLVPLSRLKPEVFNWPHLLTFLGLNLFLFLPALVLYLGFCMSLAVDRYSGQFLALHCNGLAVRTQTYAREDGKAVYLVPMMHIGEPGFYRAIAKAFPSDCVVLLEGVTDRRELLKQKLNYARMANSLGLAQQQENFVPSRGQTVQADIDVEQFSPETIQFLNLVTAIHLHGFTAETLRELLAQSQAPTVTDRLWADILDKRNDHLVNRIRTELDHSKNIAVPWGAAHMPGLARAVGEMGFRRVDSHEYEVLHFRNLVARLFHVTRT